VEGQPQYGAATTSNWLTVTRVFAIAGAVAGKTYTFTGSILSNWGNNCLGGSYPIALQIATSPDNTTYTQSGWYATRSTITTPPGVTGTATVVAPATQPCDPNGTPVFSEPTTATSSVTATGSTIYIRFTYYVQSRTCGTYKVGTPPTLCSGTTVTASDDIGISDPTFSSCV
jgi:hypothetical protein